MVDVAGWISFYHFSLSLSTRVFFFSFFPCKMQMPARTRVIVSNVVCSGILVYKAARSLSIFRSSYIIKTKRYLAGGKGVRGREGGGE